MLCPDNYIKFESEEMKFEFLKSHGFTNALANGEVPLVYRGVFTDAPQVCEVAGKIDNEIMVIAVAGQLHKIACDFLLQMQPTVKVLKEFKETGDINCIPQMTF